MPTQTEKNRLATKLAAVLERAMLKTREETTKAVQEATKAKSAGGKNITDSEINEMIKIQAQQEAQAFVEFLSENVLRRLEQLENRIYGNTV